MDASSFFGCSLNGISEKILDEVIKLVDFPLEDVEDSGLTEDWVANFQRLVPSEYWTLSSSAFQGEFQHKEVQKNLALTLDNSSEEIHSVTNPLQSDPLYYKNACLLQTSSPGSILESSSSSSKETETPINPKANGARSKHSRLLVSVTPHLSSLSIPPCSSVSKKCEPLASSETYSESDSVANSKMIGNPVIRRRKIKKLSEIYGATEKMTEPQFAVRKCTEGEVIKTQTQRNTCEVLYPTQAATEVKQSQFQQQVTVKKCRDWGVTITRQLRDGTTDQRTLCNACAVRDKKFGRLSPEHPRAANPSFVPSVHTKPQKNVNVKKCTHCEATKTPQWRQGPEGGRTLCNACGVRYRKFGHLLPEYRPAASPTFVRSIHTNFQKKVVNMSSESN